MTSPRSTIDPSATSIGAAFRCVYRSPVQGTRRSAAMLSLLLLLAVACDPNTFGGKTLAVVDLSGGQLDGEASLTLPPGADVALYESYEHGTGEGSSYRPESCFRLDVTLQQGAKRYQKECFPFGGSPTSGVRSTSCMHRSRGMPESGKACRLNDCTFKLTAGGETRARLVRRALKPCGRTVTKHRVHIKLVE